MPLSASGCDESTTACTEIVPPHKPRPGLALGSSCKPPSTARPSDLDLLPPASQLMSMLPLRLTDAVLWVAGLGAAAAGTALGGGARPMHVHQCRWMYPVAVQPSTRFITRLEDICAYMRQQDIASARERTYPSGSDVRSLSSDTTISTRSFSGTSGSRTIVYPPQKLR